MTSTRRCWPLTVKVTRRSTEPAADCCARTTELRNRYADEDTAPAAMTPLMTSRLDKPRGVFSIGFTFKPGTSIYPRAGGCTGFGRLVDTLRYGYSFSHCTG